ncbi:MAG: hypothetical protein Q8K75_07145 [Chlamydiales bacterium]|nr:hypothetical protein [Chlamydiales bacterium]
MHKDDIVALTSDVRVLVDPELKLALPAGLEQRVSEIWQEEKAKRGAMLYEGQIFNSVSVSPSLITGYWMSYRYAMAAYVDPTLGKDMKILPTAVNGITRCGGKILIALRSDNVVAYPHHWELAPSGGVDPAALVGNTIDVRKSILDELIEETGILEEDVLSVSLFAAMHNREETTLELCSFIDVSEDIISRFNPPVVEYVDFQWLSAEEVHSFGDSHLLLPLTASILKLL